jgi:hypothetical protein
MFRYQTTLEFYNIQERNNYTYQNFLPTGYSVSRIFASGGAFVGVSLDRQRFAEANGAKQRYIPQDARVVVKRGCPTIYIVSRTSMS